MGLLSMLQPASVGSPLTSQPTGLLDLLLGNSNPVAQFADNHANLFGALGAGIASGPTFSQGLANAAQMVPQAKALDAQLAQSVRSRNATVQWLRSTYPDLAAQVDAGLPIDQAWQQALARQSEQNKTYTLSPGDTLYQNGKTLYTAPMKPEAQPSAVQEYNFAVQQGYTGTFEDFQKEMKQAGAAKQVGAIPPGYQVNYDANNNPVSMSPIPGSPVAQSVDSQSNAANVSTQVINDAATKAYKLANPTTTGIGGALLGNIPISDAAELQRQVNVLKSTATINSLNAMRKASPTGGALGNVTEKEGQMLAEAAGAIDPRSPYFLSQLEQYQHTLLQIVNGPEKGEQLFQQWKAGLGGGNTTSTGVTWSVKP